VLVTPGNVEELANGILFLTRSSDIGEALGENARKEMLAKYTWQQNVTRLLERLKQS
jgi:glycosyltransferase involved in cell wall biosynthesis